MESDAEDRKHVQSMDESLVFSEPFWHQVLELTYPNQDNGDWTWSVEYMDRRRLKGKTPYARIMWDSGPLVQDIYGEWGHGLASTLSFDDEHYIMYAWTVV